MGYGCVERFAPVCLALSGWAASRYVDDAYICFFPGIGVFLSSTTFDFLLEIAIKLYQVCLTFKLYTY